MRTRIKICCISSADEARMAIEYGADAIGLVGEMPSGPGTITDDLIAEIAGIVPPPVATFLLTSRQSAGRVVEHLQVTGANTVQLVDALTSGLYLDIKAALPLVKLVQVIHVAGQKSIDEALQVAAYVDAILLDSGSPGASIKTLGGTGLVHNWQVSRQIVQAVPVPVFLAGGLTANNVKEAIETVRPYGVDVCNGVRTHGALDPLKLAAFIAAVKATDYQAPQLY